MNHCWGSARSVPPVHWRFTCQAETGSRDNESLLGFGAISATGALAPERTTSMAGWSGATYSLTSAEHTQKPVQTLNADALSLPKDLRLRRMKGLEIV